MIIVLLILFVILTFYGFMFTKNTLTQWLVGGVSFILLCLSIFALTLHFSGNWGMKEVTTTATKQIYTAGDSSATYGLLIDSQLGTSSGNYVLVYRDSVTSSKPATHFVPDTAHAAEAVKISASFTQADTDKATVTTTTTKRVFTSNLMSFFFNIGGEQNELVKEKALVTVPKDTWLVLTSKEAIELQSKAAQLQAAAAADPTAAAQMQALAKSDPTAAAKLQVAQIKQLLGLTN